MWKIKNFLCVYVFVVHVFIFFRSVWIRTISLPQETRSAINESLLMQISLVAQNILSSSTMKFFLRHLNDQELRVLCVYIRVHTTTPLRPDHSCLSDPSPIHWLTKSMKKDPLHLKRRKNIFTVCIFTVTTLDHGRRHVGVCVLTSD